MMKGNDKFSGRILNIPEQRYNMNSKIVVKKIEIPYEKYRTLSPSELAEYTHKKMVEKGFDFKKKINIHEELSTLAMIYTQKKYVVPKGKRYEKT